MGKLDLPLAVSRYCMVCGSELRVLDLEVRNAEGHGVARCPVCGFETGFAWGTAEEEGALTTTWHTDEQRRTRVVESGVTLDPEPGEPIVEVRDQI